MLQALGGKLEKILWRDKLDANRPARLVKSDR
jgi:hypothetical protein